MCPPCSPPHILNNILEIMHWDVHFCSLLLSILITSFLFREGVKNVAAGANPMGLKRGIEKAVEAAVEELKRMSKPVRGEMISQVGSLLSAACLCWRS